MNQFEDVYKDLTEEEIIEQEAAENEEYNDYDKSELPVKFTIEERQQMDYEKLIKANLQLKIFREKETFSFDGVIDKYSDLIGLVGDSYKHANKMLFYNILANQLKFNMFTFASGKVDLRLPVLLQLRAGHGKKNYVKFIRKTVENLTMGTDEHDQPLKKVYQEPTSYHPEQFVGKVVVKESKEDTEYNKIYGTLAADYLLIDEAHALLTRKENEECLRYFRTALDPIGANTIEKKQVNVPNEHKLKYTPNCSVLLLTQPIIDINPELLERGSFRRFIIVFVDVSLEEHAKALEECDFLTMNEETDKKMWEDWIQLNQKLLDLKDLKYVSILEDQRLINKYVNEDMARFNENGGTAVIDFYRSFTFTAKINIFKMAIVRAVMSAMYNDKDDIKVIEVRKPHITAAIKDWDALWISQVQWIARQLNFAGDKPINWNDKIHPKLLVIFETTKDNIMNFKDIEINYKKLSSNLSDTTIKNHVAKGLKQLHSWGYLIRRGDQKKGFEYKLKVEKTKELEKI